MIVFFSTCSFGMFDDLGLGYNGEVGNNVLDVNSLLLYEAVFVLP